tara:strand:- start:127 stop:675 length:549 start_codon:yes stop_codon:yes gene_type:complete
MPSDLQVDNIKDGSATKTLATLSSSAVTLHSDVTFPTGHVIKTETKTIGSDGNSSTTSWTSSPFKADASVTFTPKLGTSSILLIASFQTYSSATYAYYDFYKHASDFTETYNLSGKQYGLSMMNLSSNWESKMMMHLDPVTENSNSTKTYSISARAHDSGTVYIGFSTANSVQTITMMEIAA